MSISATGQETLNTQLNSHAAAGATLEESIDAQEDREIVGYSLSIITDGADGAPDMARGVVEAFLGTDPGISGAGEGNTASQDNLSWFVRHVGKSIEDDVNQKTTVDGGNHGEWYGRGDGFEWNEDVTLTISNTAQAGDAHAHLVVYYVER